MRIDQNNLHLANAAIRDILFAYRDLIESYRGFGHGIDTGTFDPFAFLDVEISEAMNESLGLNRLLLRSGAAIAILCAISDAWDEKSDEVSQSQFFRRIRQALGNDTLKDLPDLRRELLVGLENETEFRDGLSAIYEKYVCGYFDRLLEGITIR